MSWVLKAFAFATVAISGITFAITREDGVSVFTDMDFDRLSA